MLILLVAQCLLASVVMAGTLSGWGRSFCVRQTNGQIYCYGMNFNGEFGVGNRLMYPFPVKMLGVKNATDHSHGEGHTCLVDQQYVVKCTGSNWRGQLGDGTTKDSNVLMQTTGLTSLQVSRVYVGYGYHTCALLVSGGLRCWGDNSKGQLGIGTKSPWNRYPSIVEGFESTGVREVSLGLYFTCILTKNGGVMCTGDNAKGYLGISTSFTDTARMVQVIGLTQQIVSISSGNLHTCAVDTSGGLRCWGENDSGQLGLVAFFSSVPNYPSAALKTGVVAVQCGYQASFAIHAGSRNVTAFGAVPGGGYSSWPSSFLGGIGGVKEIQGGGNAICMIIGDNGEQIECLGFDGYGQLGDGYPAERPYNSRPQFSTVLPFQSYTFQPTTGSPTSQRPTKQPSPFPTKKPSAAPTDKYTRRPTAYPTKKPTRVPTDKYTRRPTAYPTKKPTRVPTVKPTRKPTAAPTVKPTKKLTSKPTKKPSKEPTVKPSKRPTSEPTRKPTRKPQVV